MNANTSPKNVASRQNRNLKTSLTTFEKRSTRHSKKIKSISEEITGYYQRLVEEHQKSVHKNSGAAFNKA